MSKSNDPSRRQVLTGIGATLGVAALGCGGAESTAPDAQAGVDPSSVDAAAPDANPRAYCTEPAGMSAEALLAHIDTFVVLCMENRSFDHYFGSLSLLEGRTDVNGLTGTESNPSANGATIGVHRLDNFTPADPPHSWDACHAQWNNGANDGFVKEHEGDNEADVMGYHVREQLPVLYALADQAALCHHWYSSLLGPTWPNRFYLHGATAHGRQSNLPPILGFNSIFGVLDDAGISNVNYFHDFAFASGGYGKLTGLDRIEEYFDAAMAGTLPQFSIIDPKFTGQGANDDHPDHDIRLGQALIGSVVSALAQSPQWERSLLVITYDEHGGFYDHVAPPTTQDEELEFRQLGIRVPSVVVGPTVRRGCAIDNTFEHTSVIATLTKRFGLAPLNDRVAVTYDLSPCIDPALIDNPQPPPEVPPIDISLREIWQRPAVASHPELVQSLAARPLPAHLDRRGRDREVVNSWLERAERVGAVRIRD